MLFSLFFSLNYCFAAVVLIAANKVECIFDTRVHGPCRARVVCTEFETVYQWTSTTPEHDSFISWRPLWAARRRVHSRPRRRRFIVLVRNNLWRPRAAVVSARCPVELIEQLITAAAAASARNKSRHNALTVIELYTEPRPAGRLSCSASTNSDLQVFRFPVTSHTPTVSRVYPSFSQRNSITAHPITTRSGVASNSQWRGSELRRCRSVPPFVSLPTPLPNPLSSLPILFPMLISLPLPPLPAGKGAWGSAIAPPAGPGIARPPNAFSCNSQPKICKSVNVNDVVWWRFNTCKVPLCVFSTILSSEFFDIFQWGLNPQTPLWLRHWPHVGRF